MMHDKYIVNASLKHTRYLLLQTYPPFTGSNNIFDLSSISILLCFLWKGVVLETRPQMNEILMLENF